MCAHTQCEHEWGWRMSQGLSFSRLWVDLGKGVWEGCWCDHSSCQWRTIMTVLFLFFSGHLPFPLLAVTTGPGLQLQGLWTGMVPELGAVTSPKGRTERAAPSPRRQLASAVSAAALSGVEAVPPVLHLCPFPHMNQRGLKEAPARPDGCLWSRPAPWRTLVPSKGVRAWAHMGRRVRDEHMAGLRHEGNPTLH